MNPPLADAIVPAPERVPIEPRRAAEGLAPLGTRARVLYSAIDAMTQSQPGPRASLATRPAALDASQQRLLAEALRRAEQARVTIEGALVEFGRWLLGNVFDNDPEAALQGRRDNPVWRELLARAGGRTLRFSRHMLYVAVHIAARDRLIVDEAWRMLEPGRKELLLPLRDEEPMKKAARHVMAAGLTQRETREYVKKLRAQGRGGAEPALRITPKRAGALVRRVAGPLVERKTLARVCAQLGRLEGDARAETRETLRALRGALDAMEKALAAGKRSKAGPKGRAR